MRRSVVTSLVIVAFLLGATASQVFQRSKAAACESEIAADMASVGFFAGALRKLDDGEPASAIKVLEMGLALKAKRAANLASTGGVPFDSTMTPNLREGLSRALAYAEARPLDGATLESLRHLHKSVEPVPIP